MVDPLATYPLAAGGERSADVLILFRDLAQGEPTDPLRAAAQDLLRVDPSFHPASLIVAQTYFVDGDFAAAVRTLDPVVEQVADYPAAQLLLGCSAEKVGEVVRAVEAYGATGSLRPIAEERLETLLPVAEGIVARRIEDALRRGRPEIAREELERLRRWSPESPVALESWRSIAVAEENPKEELVAVRALRELYPEERSLLADQADLELSVGDPRAGLEIYQSLSAEFPEDEQLRLDVARAKFRWRVSQLPAEVREAGAKAALSRADHALLLYWVAPPVRYGRPGAGRIASDILDHPHREAIARVVNLGLMRLQTSVHRFEPEEEVTRLEVLESLLRIGATDRRPAACLTGIESNRRPSSSFVCEVAARCGLIASSSDCLPSGTVSGTEDLELIRRGLLLLGS